MTSRRYNQSGFSDTSVIGKVLILSIIVAIITCCNRWVKSVTMRRAGYEQVDPNEPPPDPDANRGYVVDRDRLR